MKESWNLCLGCLSAEFHVVGPSPRSLVYCPDCRNRGLTDKRVPRVNQITETRPIDVEEGKRRHNVYDLWRTP